MLREESQPYAANDKKNSKQVENTRDVKLVDKDQEIHIGSVEDDDEAE